MATAEQISNGAHPQREGESEAVVIVKAAPQVGQAHGETVCCAALDANSNWLRLYPVAFRRLSRDKRFARWDRIRFQWSLPSNDPRPESRRINHQSIVVVGCLRDSERGGFLARALVTSVERERRKGKSLALLDCEILDFFYERKTPDEIARERARFASAVAQADLFARPIRAYAPAEYRFKYRYRSEDGIRTGTCQDWEMDTTFFNWRRRYSESDALAKVHRIFGVEYPRKGMALAMGTHSLHPDTWLINGVIRFKRSPQLSLL